MFIGLLPAVSNRATWSENCEIIDNDTGELLELTGLDEVTVEVRDPDTRSVVLSASLTDGDVVLIADTSAVVTITIASPGVVSWPDHGLEANDAVVFSTTGALPTGITAGTFYYVIETGLTDDTFRFSATLGGSAVATSGSQSGTHTAEARYEGVFQWRFEASEMRNLDAQTYEVGVTLEQDDDTVQLIIGTVPVIDGVVT